MMRAMRWVLLLILAAAPAIADDAGPASDQLDFALTQHGDSYTLHDDAYTVTFPGKPTLQSLTFPVGQAQGHGLVASLIASTSEYSVLFKPVPRTVWVNAKQSIDTVRDAFVQSTHAQVLSESRTKLAGLDARHIVASAPVNGGHEALDITLAWDGDHRTIVAIVIGSATATQSASGRAFVDSLAITHGGRGPIDPHTVPAEGVAVPSGVLDLEVVRHGAAYVVRDAAIEVTFPQEPAIRTLLTTPITVVGAEAYADEIEGFSFGIALASPTGTYDVDKGMTGTRTEILAQFDKGARHVETQVKRAGLVWKRSTISAAQGGLPVRAELDMTWDPQRRALISVMASTRKKALTPAARAFLDSVVVHGTGAPAP